MSERKQWTTEKELKVLLKDYENNPNDLDLMNLIAIWYMENPWMEECDESHDFFEKAYNQEKTIKSTNNFAYHLYSEFYDHKKTLIIQKECMELKPKSQGLYILYWELLIANEKYKEAVDSLKNAKEKWNNRYINHSLGYCEFMLWNYSKAKKYFFDASKDNDIALKSLFWLAVTYYKLHDKENVYRILDEIKTSPYYNERLGTLDGPNISNVEDDYSVWSLYFLYEDYRKSAENTIDVMNRKCTVGFWSWYDDLLYSIFKADNEYFCDFVNFSINQYQEWIDEINHNHDDRKDETEEEKKESLHDYQWEIDKIRTTVDSFKLKPNINIDKYISREWFSCVLFDCKIHWSIKNDWDE